MSNLIELIQKFEMRNNISISVTIYSDGSSITNEFWEEETLNESKTIEELFVFLSKTNYKLKNGRCLSPVEKIQ